METALFAIVPVVLAMLLGYAAGWQHDETPDTAKSINLMVLHYALPLALFAATVVTPRAELLKQGPLALILLGGMVIPYTLWFAVQYVATRDISTSVLRALGFGLPAVPFLGFAILTPLVGALTSIVVSIAACVINLVVVPATFVLLALGSRKPASPGAKAATRPTQGIGRVVLDALKEPVVWAPVCGLVLVFAGVSVPKQVLTAVQFLGGTSGAVSLFASGVILQAQRPTLSGPIATSTLARNVAIPGLALVVLRLLHVDPTITRAAVLALAIPAGAMQMTLALRYATKEQENASFLLYSNLFSVATISAFSLVLA